jgi:hypothetical protein
MRIKYLIGPVLYLAVIALTGCGGTDSQGLTDGPGDSSFKTVITGVASKGPINTGTVKVFAIRNDAVDTTVPIGQGQTDAAGNFTVDVGGFKGPVMVEVAGGSFTDEVSGEIVTLPSPMQAVVPDATTGTNKVAVTPLTELATRRAKGHDKITVDVINESNKSVAAIFNLADIVSTLPVAGGTDDNQKKYAASCGAFSQLANNKRKSSGGSQGDGKLGEALKGVMDDMGNEAEHTGLSDDSITKIKNAETDFNSGKNKNDTQAPIINPTNGILKISTSGSPNIGALDMTVTIPAGVEVAADPITGEAAAGAVTISGVAATSSNKLIAAKVTPASGGNKGKLTISMVNGTGFGPGECITVDFKVATGGTFPAKADFAVSAASAKGLDGTPLSSVTAAPASVGAL